MADREFVQKWIEKAKQDFDYASLSLDEEFEYFPQICWHFQQAAEKYLKTYIVAYDLEFRKIYDLAALINICGKKDPTFNLLLESCKHLQRYYIETRYPVVWEIKWKREDAINAKEAAKEITDFVKERIALFNV
ncbi:MAG: HEPN domain-containing protein [Candidatus Margulisbacteria bacterium]|nr:HEPN domain-containing protein [Candidatus Margulisiibacteriota bacterium]